MSEEVEVPRVAQIFAPYMAQRARELIAEQGRLVYYTTAETATRILTNRQVLMRSTTAMNDYREVDHGFECLNASYDSEPGKAFDSALGFLENSGIILMPGGLTFAKIHTCCASQNIYRKKTSMVGFLCGGHMAGKRVSL